MNTKVVEDFYLTALSYCKLVETTDITSDDFLVKFLHLLLDLYSKVLSLPDVESERTEEIDLVVPTPHFNFHTNDSYWEVFHPYQLEEPVASSLSDDIIDIYKDVKKGLFLYHKNEQTEAVWQWKFSFDIHWGGHAVDAIRALHYVSR